MASRGDSVTTCRDGPLGWEMSTHSQRKRAGDPARATSPPLSKEGQTAAPGQTAHSPGCTCPGNSLWENGGGGVFGQDWGWGVLSQPKRQMSALAFRVRVVQSEQNKHGAGFLRPRAQPKQGLQPRARLRGQENRGVRQTRVPGSAGSPRRAAIRLTTPDQAGLTRQVNGDFTSKAHMAQELHVQGRWEGC